MGSVLILALFISFRNDQFEEKLKKSLNLEGRENRVSTFYCIFLKLYILLRTNEEIRENVKFEVLVNLKFA